MTTIYCGVIDIRTNAQVLGKDVLKAEESALFFWQDELMNRLIHRSWGESALTFPLDLSTHISHGNTILVYSLIP